MTPSQGLVVAVDLTILVGMIVVMLLVTIIVLLQLKKKVTEAIDSMQAQVKSVTDRAHGVIDQAQHAVSAVTGRFAAFERVVGGIGGALTAATAAKTARRVAKNSAGMAGSVLAGLKAGVDRLRQTDHKGKDDLKDG